MQWIWKVTNQGLEKNIFVSALNQPLAETEYFCFRSWDTVHANISELITDSLL